MVKQAKLLARSLELEITILPVSRMNWTLYLPRHVMLSRTKNEVSNNVDRGIFQSIKSASAVIYDRRAFELKNGHQRAGKG